MKKFIALFLLTLSICQAAGSLTAELTIAGRTLKSLKHHSPFCLPVGPQKGYHSVALRFVGNNLEVSGYKWAFPLNREGAPHVVDIDAVARKKLQRAVPGLVRTPTDIVLVRASNDSELIGVPAADPGPIGVFTDGPMGIPGDHDGLIGSATSNPIFEGNKFSLWDTSLIFDKFLIFAAKDDSASLIRAICIEKYENYKYPLVSGQIDFTQPWAGSLSPAKPMGYFMVTNGRVSLIIDLARVK